MEVYQGKSVFGGKEARRKEKAGTKTGAGKEAFY